MSYCLPPDPNMVLMHVDAVRTTIILLILALVGLLCYAIDTTITHDHGPPPEIGKQ